MRTPHPARLSPLGVLSCIHPDPDPDTNTDSPPVPIPYTVTTLYKSIGTGGESVLYVV